MPSSTHALFARTGVLAMVPVIASVYSVLAAAASTGSWDELGSAKVRSDDDDDDAPLLCFSDYSDDDDDAPLSVCLTTATTTTSPSLSYYDRVCHGFDHAASSASVSSFLKHTFC